MTTVQPTFRRRPTLRVIHGGSVTPDDIQREFLFGLYRAFPRSVRIEGHESLWLRYTISVLDSEYADYGVIAKQLVGWLDLAGQQIGMIILDEWHITPGATELTFMNATDCVSQSTYDFGEAVVSAWPIRRLPPGKPIVELSRVWMHPDHARHSLWARAVEALIRKRYTNRFSMLLLNAWPADHKAAEARQLDWRGLDTWDRRRTSIGRLAQAALGVRPLPEDCLPDDRWWYWRPLSNGVPHPRKRRLKRA